EGTPKFRSHAHLLWNRWVAPPKRMDQVQRTPLYGDWDNLCWLRPVLRPPGTPSPFPMSGPLHRRLFPELYPPETLYRPYWARESVLPDFSVPPLLFRHPTSKALLGGRVATIPRTTKTDEMVALLTWPRAAYHLTEHYIRMCYDINQIANK